MQSFDLLTILCLGLKIKTKFGLSLEWHQGPPERKRDRLLRYATNLTHKRCRIHVCVHTHVHTHEHRIYVIYILSFFTLVYQFTYVLLII